jgi:hypothetical protein
MEIFWSACAFFQCQSVLDMFASHAHHTVSRFVSQVYAPGCEAIDALRLDWSEVVRHDQAECVFPPYQCVSVALSLLERYKIEALVCMSVKAGSNKLIQLEQMERAVKSSPFMIPRVSGSCKPSNRAPDNSLNSAFLGLGIIHVTWQ